MKFHDMKWEPNKITGQPIATKRSNMKSESMLVIECNRRAIANFLLYIIFLLLLLLCDAFGKCVLQFPHPPLPKPRFSQFLSIQFSCLAFLRPPPGNGGREQIEKEKPILVDVIRCYIYITKRQTIRHRQIYTVFYMYSRLKFI